MYSFSDVCALFKIDRSTLWRWCKKSGIAPCRSPVDYRIRNLTDDELLQLARLHHRVLMIDADGMQLSQIERLEARMAELEAKTRQ